MNAPSGMTEHGIMTTKADYWIHLFPFSYEVFWYRVSHCRAYIERKKVPIHLGKSADGTATGNGYCIPKKAFFVSVAEVPVHYLAHADWKDMTDRELGFAGEPVVDALIEHQIIKFPLRRASPLRGRQEQFSARDLEVSWLQPFTVEIKTERRSDTGNLYVQTHEGGHRPHQIRGANQVVERYSDAPPLEDGIPF